MISSYRTGIIEVYTLINLSAFATLIALGVVVTAICEWLRRRPNGTLLVSTGYAVLGLITYACAVIFTASRSGPRIVLVLGAVHAYPLLAVYIALRAFQSNRREGLPIRQAIRQPLLIAIPATLIYLLFLSLPYIN